MPYYNQGIRIDKVTIWDICDGKEKNMNPKNQEVKRLTQESVATAAAHILISGKELTVSDISRRAGVSRNAFYRNFDTVDDALLHYLTMGWGSYAETHPMNERDQNEINRHLVRYFYQQKEFLRALRTKDMLAIMEKLFIRIIIPENIAGGVRYYLYTTAFAMYGFIRAMIDNDFADSPDEIEKMSLPEKK